MKLPECITDSSGLHKVYLANFFEKLENRQVKRAKASSHEKQACLVDPRTDNVISTLWRWNARPRRELVD